MKNKEKQLVPKIRFPGFTDPWEQRKFSELGKNYSTGTLGYSDLDNNGVYPCVLYGELYTTYNEEINIVKSSTNKEAFIALKNDVLFPTSTTADAISLIAPSSVNVDSVRAGGDLFVIRPTEEIDGRFISYQINNVEHIKRNFSKKAQGLTIVHIHYSSLANENILIPNLDEQLKIVSFCEEIDNLITLHQRKCDDLQKQKKALLQKMFPKNGENIPEIRFPGFTDPWEQRKLDVLTDVLDGDRGKNYPTESDYLEKGHTLFMNAANVTANGFLFLDNQFISEEKSNSMGNGKLQEDDLVITSRGSIGHIAWYNASVLKEISFVRINSGMLILRKKEEIDTSYLYQFLKSDKGQNQISFISFGSAQPQLTKKEVKNLSIIFPKESAEQVKLGSFFNQLDNLITLHQRKCDDLQKQKKALLQQMFI